ncbi:MAG: cell division protein ZapB [bacterium]|nr:cell division protein ZapB [bacterium]
MVIKQLELLEEKIDEALGEIDRLKKENQELKMCGSPFERLDVFKRENEELKNEKMILKDKIRKLLHHLEELEGGGNGE